MGPYFAVTSRYLPGKELEHHRVRVLPSLSILSFFFVSDERIKLCTILERHTKDWTTRRFAVGGVNAIDPAIPSQHVSGETILAILTLARRPGSKKSR